MMDIFGEVYTCDKTYSFIWHQLSAKWINWISYKLQTSSTINGIISGRVSHNPLRTTADPIRRTKGVQYVINI